MEIDFLKNKFYYHDPKLSMDSFSLFIYRVIISVFYFSLTIGIILLFFNGRTNFKYLSILIAIFLLDRIINRNDSEKQFDIFFNKKLNIGKKINIALYSSGKFKKILNSGTRKAISSNTDLYLTLLEKFLIQNDFQRIFSKLDIDMKEFYNSLKLEMKKEGMRKTRKENIDLAKKLAITSISFQTSDSLKPKDLFLTLFFFKNSSIEKLMNQFDFSQEDLSSAVVFGEFKKKFSYIKKTPMTLSSFIKQMPFAGQRIMNRAWTARPTPLLDSISIDLTNLARNEQVGFMIGHKKESQQLINILSRPGKNNCVLIGEEGSGKETIVSHLAYKIVTDNIPPELFDKRLVMLSVSQLASGISPGQILEKTQKIVHEILRAKNIILYIPDFGNLTRTSGAHFLSAADALLPVLGRGDFQVIASVSHQDFKRDIEKNKDLLSTLELVRVDEISEQEAIQLLSYLSVILENQYNINISFKAIKRAVGISKRYFRDKLLPSSAEDLLKETLAYIRNLDDNDLNEEDVIAVAQNKINVPLSEAKEEETEKLLNLEEIIHKKLIDQEEAVRAVSRALREYRAGLSRKGGPIATFLFAGPTGVGKTELSKILTEIQFGSRNNMIRFDMSEFQNKRSIFRFIGSPEGETPGILTESVRQKPYSLILLDEFEKSHPDILNLFLSLFDDGRLTDNTGRVIDFTNTIIIATSNAHSELIKQRLEQGKKVEEISEELKKKLTDYFRPELINRFSSVIAFKSLSPEDVRKITIMMLNELSKTMEQEHKVNLTFSESSLDRLIEIGYSKVYGARPMRNAISDNIKSILSEKILRKEFNKGDKIIIKFKKDKFVVEKNK
jgi:ATP-dependent Clp protease ATP-binding subunit ClpC